MRRIDDSLNEGNLGFQIAPMIDVVFVIMLFFMVMAGAVKIEKELNTTLPGSAEVQPNSDLPDEQTITISDTGEVALNDQPMDTSVPADTHQLPELAGALTRLKQNADAAKTQLMVTIVSDQSAKYARTVDVLDALAQAQISNVTFTVNEEE
ncbi:MAG TPA: biopolymer transporter ExbD [Chthoniobacterales bacterium]